MVHTLGQKWEQIIHEMKEFLAYFRPENAIKFPILLQIEKKETFLSLLFLVFSCVSFISFHFCAMCKVEEPGQIVVETR